MAKYVIWTLNAAIDIFRLDPSPELDIEDPPFYKIRGTLNDVCGGRKNWEFGSRKDENGDDTNNLMPGPEYFVPITAKCIGNKFDGNTDLKDIKDYYENLWNTDYKFFWKNNDRSEKSPRMLTDNFTGYYEILEKELKSQNADRVILIGYSQGGLVARYLAWLDEYIFKKNIIKCVITIQSPNFGSPLGNPSNRDPVVDGIIQALWSLFSFYYKDFAPLIDCHKKIFEFEHLIAILENMYTGVRNKNDVKPESKRGLEIFLSTALKWLSGLNEKVANTAFHDLNIFNIEKPHTVLNCIHNNEIKNIYYGSVISADNSFDSFITSVLNESIGKGFTFIINNALGKLKILERSIRENFDELSKIDKKIIMDEYVKKNGNDQKIDLNDIDDPKIKKIIEYNRNGADSGDLNFLGNEKSLKQGSHDFVISSAYQLSLNNNTKYFLGNYININANHNSGKAYKFKGGKDNCDFIIEFLKLMKKRGL